MTDEKVAWEDEFASLLTDPDEVGSSEYRTVHEHVLCVIESANIGGDDPREMVQATLDTLAAEVEQMRREVKHADERMKGEGNETH